MASKIKQIKKRKIDRQLPTSTPSYIMNCSKGQVYIYDNDMSQYNRLRQRIWQHRKNKESGVKASGKGVFRSLIEHNGKTPEQIAIDKEILEKVLQHEFKYQSTYALGPHEKPEESDNITSVSGIVPQGNSLYGAVYDTSMNTVYVSLVPGYPIINSDQFLQQPETILKIGEALKTNPASLVNVDVPELPFKIVPPDANMDLGKENMNNYPNCPQSSKTEDTLNASFLMNSPSDFLQPISKENNIIETTDTTFDEETVKNKDGKDPDHISNTPEDFITNHSLGTPCFRTPSPQNCSNNVFEKTLDTPVTDGLETFHKRDEILEQTMQFKGELLSDSKNMHHESLFNIKYKRKSTHADGTKISRILLLDSITKSEYNELNMASTNHGTNTANELLIDRTCRILMDQMLDQLEAHHHSIDYIKNISQNAENNSLLSKEHSKEQEDVVNSDSTFNITENLLQRPDFVHRSKLQPSDQTKCIESIDQRDKNQDIPFQENLMILPPATTEPKAHSGAPVTADQTKCIEGIDQRDNNLDMPIQQKLMMLPPTNPETTADSDAPVIDPSSKNEELPFAPNLEPLTRNITEPSADTETKVTAPLSPLNGDDITETASKSVT